MDLFSTFSINGMELNNRFVRSATFDATADDTGAVTDESVAIYKELGKGGVGLIFSGYAFVSPLGKAVPGQYGVHSDDMIPGLQRLVQAAHEGGAKIALQIVHAGNSSISLAQEGIPALAVLKVDGATNPHREMTGEEIETIVTDFAAAAARAKEAGFDAVQLHGAHGYLMSQFLSPLTNRRTDLWGGSPDNRRRFHLEVIDKARAVLGSDYPLMIKLGAEDDAEGGLTLSETLETARQMVAHTIDAIEVSTGSGDMTIVIQAKGKNQSEDAFFRNKAASVKGAVNVPVMAVGGVRNLGTAKDIIQSGHADLVSMCRPFVREPGLIARWQNGDGADAKCISCNKCLNAIVAPILKKEPRVPLRCQEEIVA